MSYLRVISGEYRGRKLVCPKGRDVRPTTSRLREAIFSICQHRIAGARFLDLFSGSGAMGIEALSRGAEHATLVEKDREAIRAIEENSRTLGLQTPNRIALWKGEVLSVLARLGTVAQPFDLVYMDPPYQYGEERIIAILRTIATHRLLVEGGWILVEEGRQKEERELEVEGLVRKQVRTYGKTQITLWEKGK